MIDFASLMFQKMFKWSYNRTGESIIFFYESKHNDN